MEHQDTVTVTMFAALGDAAGTTQVTVPAPVSLPDLLDDLRTRFGDDFAERLSIAAVMVDGRPVPPGSEMTLLPDADVALLPPFAGG